MFLTVITSGNSLSFGFKGEATKIQLPQGQYKLEVWGAEGGESTGDAWITRGNSAAKGGLGGYSTGILRLNKKDTVYVFVGGKGCPSNSQDSSSTKGGFPDGGGTKTGHHESFTTVPGTGGGSTSIRIGNNTDYARVIVAGGGGGASGCCIHTYPGGFGGGLSGGNCFYNGSIQSQGAGTQTCSTPGFVNGDPGLFGSGADGKYMQKCDSGGGGGGGWYGGGSGGFGKTCHCSGGGGGSGWTFTEASFREFQSGDSENASKFVLDNAYYLSDVKCIGGDEEFPRSDGNGTEKGHSGNGNAKITLL